MLPSSVTLLEGICHLLGLSMIGKICKKSAKYEEFFIRSLYDFCIKFSLSRRIQHQYGLQSAKLSCSLLWFPDAAPECYRSPNKLPPNKLSINNNSSEEKEHELSIRKDFFSQKKIFRPVEIAADMFLLLPKSLQDSSWHNN